MFIYGRKCGFPHLGISAFFCTETLVPTTKLWTERQFPWVSLTIYRYHVHNSPHIFPSHKMCSFTTFLKFILCHPSCGLSLYSSSKTPQPAERSVLQSPACPPIESTKTTHMPAAPPHQPVSDFCCQAPLELEGNIHPGMISTQRALEDSQDRDSSYSVEWLFYFFISLINTDMTNLTGYRLESFARTYAWQRKCQAYHCHGSSWKRKSNCMQMCCRGQSTHGWRTPHLSVSRTCGRQ